MQRAHFETGSFAPYPVGSPFAVEAIWVDENGSPWVGGGDGKVRVRTGGAWANRDVTGTSVKAIWGRSATDVYAGGSGVFRYNGATWEDTQFSGFGGGVVAIWGTADRLFAYDGSVWELVGTSWESVGPRSLLAEGPHFVQGNALWATQFDASGLSVIVIRWNGSTWDEFRFPDSDVYGPSALAARPSGDAWAFGPLGAIRHRAVP